MTQEQKILICLKLTKNYGVEARAKKIADCLEDGQKRRAVFNRGGQSVIVAALR